ncbi:MAG TPA: hypothetical protein VFJ16_11675, partial [Longimicrobium sp.]|nr:hypothetical protein [Longimicrobium sp.]
HVGGDDFVLICPQDQARRLSEEARRRFDTGLRRHLPADAVTAGRYHGVDRSGEAREFPLTHLSAALVRIDPARWPAVEHLGEVVANAKRQAKAEGSGGIVELDAMP